MAIGWLKAATLNATKPSGTLIDLLRKRLGGYNEGRDRSTLHASDITYPDFCPRQWAIHDIQEKKNKGQYINTALAVTFSIGRLTARAVIEDWLGDVVVGHWRCRHCGSQRSFCKRPLGYCKNDGTIKHDWEYLEVVFIAPDYAVSGSIDVLVDLGSPLLEVVELKILSVDEFEKIMAPKPEHRIRTALYMKLISEGDSVIAKQINLLRGTVLYVSRGHGKLNPVWGEILPFKEFPVDRDDSVIQSPLKKAKALKIFRAEAKMPSGICGTALDKTAQKCDVCKECFSGLLPALVKWENL